MVSFFRLTFQSCCGEGGTLQTNITGICRECSQCLGHTGFAPAHGVCAFPVYTAQALGWSAGNSLRQALHFMHFPGLSCSGSGSWVLCKGTDLIGHEFYALPRSKELRPPGAWQAHCPRWAVHLNHLPSPGPSVSQVHLESTISGVPCVPSGELISAVTLLADFNRLPGRFV